MGRHRNDPRGIAQMLAIGGVIVLFITLVVLGIFFLVNSLPSEGDTAVPENAGTTADPQADNMQTGTLLVRVIGESSDVLVRVPGGDVLADSSLDAGEHLTFDEPHPLNVTIGSPSEVELYVHGERRDVSDEGADYNFTVDP